MKRKEEQHMKKKEKRTLLKLKRQKPGTWFDKTNGGNCRGTETQIFLQEYRQQIFEVVV